MLQFKFKLTNYSLLNLKLSIYRRVPSSADYPRFPLLIPVIIRFPFPCRRHQLLCSLNYITPFQFNIVKELLAGRCYTYGIVATFLSCFIIFGVYMNFVGIVFFRNDNHKLTIVFLYNYQTFL